MEDWFARPVLFVTDVERTLAFYIDRLGFHEAWRHAEEGRVIVAQADRDGAALIFDAQHPHLAGKGRMFISFDPDERIHDVEAEFRSRGVEMREGQWGYRLLIVPDPDGNELWFPYPGPPAA